MRLPSEPLRLLRLDAEPRLSDWSEKMDVRRLPILEADPRRSVSEAKDVRRLPILELEPRLRRKTRYHLSVAKERQNIISICVKENLEYCIANKNKILSPCGRGEFQDARFQRQVPCQLQTEGSHYTSLALRNDRSGSKHDLACHVGLERPVVSAAGGKAPEKKTVIFCQHTMPDCHVLRIAMTVFAQSL
ncbi:hypothetical protein ElyMa_002874600 [Elysia marginata]|uniref:Uncharacterized protein n=1 Tax=Elysia marginata TaxID=1093978 RepID=A0AAV4HY38_9GAST|nr:hypothetical protein ElyMa_002874600 [Elysia marginata]